MKDKIKELYQDIEVKKDFIIKVAEKLEKSPLTIRTHWFGNFWMIPEEYQKPVLKMLRTEIKKQKVKA